MNAVDKLLNGHRARGISRRFLDQYAHTNWQCVRTNLQYVCTKNAGVVILRK